MRKIIVNGIEYKWKAGKTFVEIRSSDEKFLVSKADFFLEPEIPENVEYPYIARGAITPSIIKDYICQIKTGKYVPITTLMWRDGE